MSRRRSRGGQVGVATRNGEIVLHFGQPVAWVGLDPGGARKLALTVRQKADELDPPALIPDVPPANRIPENLAGLAFLAIEDIDIGSYTPEPDGKGVCTEVHLRIKVKGLPAPLIMRFHGPAGLDRFIEALRRHRADVWPGSSGEGS